MRIAILVTLLAAVTLAGCGGLGGLGGGDLSGILSGLGPTVCSVYDTNGDGAVTIAEVRNFASGVFAAFSDAELTEALQMYGCNVQ